MENRSTRPRTILVVDDSADYLNFVRLFLEAEGYTVDAAQSTEELEERLRERRPDLVISDVRIPGHEAFVVLDLLRGDQQTRDIPVLLCTAAVQEVEAASERLRLDRVEILFKPFDVDVMLDHIRRLTRTQEKPRV